MNQHTVGVVFAFQFRIPFVAPGHPIRRHGFEQNNLFGSHFRVCLVQRSQVVDQPETAPVGGGNEVVVFHGQIVDRHGR